MAVVHTLSDDNNYEFYVANVCSIKGECQLKMANFKELCSLVKWLLEKDRSVEVTTSNAAGCDLAEYLARHGFQVIPSGST